MSYIWNSLLKAEEEGIGKNNIEFVKAEIISPYIEVLFDDLNATNLPDDNKIEVNIYYRFYEIFKDLFSADYKEHEKLREILLDILLHYLGELDLKSGISRNQLYKVFIYNDMKNGAFGESLKNNIKGFNKKELDIFLDGVITLYSTGTSMLLFKRVLKNIFINCSCYENIEDTRKIYIYVNIKESRCDREKLKAIIDTFLPLNTKILIFWDKHFGVIDKGATMKIDNIVMVE